MYSTVGIKNDSRFSEEKKERERQLSLSRISASEFWNDNFFEQKNLDREKDFVFSRVSASDSFLNATLFGRKNVDI